MVSSFLRHIFFSLTIISGLGCSQITDAQKGLLNTTSPSILYTLIDYSDLYSETLLGKTTVVLFWDAHCSHCKKAMPKANELARSFLNAPDAAFVAVNVNKREEEEIVKDQIAYQKLDGFIHSFSGYAFEDEAYRAFEGVSVPYFVIIDSKGVIRWLGDDVDDLRDQFFSISKRAVS